MDMLTAAETPTLGRTSTFPSIRGYPCCVSIPSRSKIRPVKPKIKYKIASKLCSLSHLHRSQIVELVQGRKNSPELLRFQGTRRGSYYWEAPTLARMRPSCAKLRAPSTMGRLGSVVGSRDL